MNTKDAKIYINLKQAEEDGYRTEAGWKSVGRKLSLDAYPVRECYAICPGYIRNLYSKDQTEPPKPKNSRT